MSEILKKEGSLVTLKLNVKGDEFVKAEQKAYQKNKSKFSIQGFRKGKAPKKIIESYYGEGVFFEDALNEVFPFIFKEAVEEHDLDVVSQPEIQEVGDIKKGEDISLTISVYVSPEVTLGEYKNLDVKKEEVEVTEEEIDKDIETKREQNARMITIEDRSAKEGDTVLIDFTGKVDGIEFDGGHAEGHSLVLGSKSFIDGFEDQVAGMKLEEEKDITVTFPEDYPEESLKGKEAVFSVKLHEIKEKELPELDDEFVKDISDFDTLDELRADVRAKIFDSKQKFAESTHRNALIDKAVENASLEIPEVMIEREMESMLNEFSQNLQYQGLNVSDYFKYTGSSMESLKQQMRPEAEKKVKNALVLFEIAKVENIESTEEDLEQEYVKMSEQYNMDVEKIKSLIGGSENEMLKDNIRIRKTVDFLVAESK